MHTTDPIINGIKIPLLRPYFSVMGATTNGPIASPNMNSDVDSMATGLLTAYFSDINEMLCPNIEVDNCVPRAVNA